MRRRRAAHPTMLAVLAAALLAGGCGTEDQAPSQRLTYHPVPGVTSLQSAEIERVLIKRLSAAGVEQANVSAIGCDVVISFAGDAAAATRSTVKALTAPGRAAIYDWEDNVVGPDGRPAAADRTVTGGAGAGGAVSSISRREAEQRAAKRPGASPRRIIVRADGEPGDHWYVLEDAPALTAVDIERARLEADGTASPAVSLAFTPRGARLFSAVTRKLADRGRRAAAAGADDVQANQHFAIVVDGRIVTVPYIDARQNPDGVDGAAGALISGGLTVRSASHLAALLTAGPLPARLALAES
jgi:preprotein translocase subunit SecD